jgi:hypothetical protein
MRVWKLCLAATLAGVIFMALPAAAKQKKEEKTEWEFYGDPKNEGQIPGEAYRLKDLKKVWKASGKLYYDDKASPSPFAVITNHNSYLEYLDGKRAYATFPLKVKPGVHTVVVSLSGPGVVSKDAVAFKIRCEAGREYLLKATWGKKLFRKGTWAPYVIWRQIPPGYPKEKRASK